MLTGGRRWRCLREGTTATESRDTESGGRRWYEDGNRQSGASSGASGLPIDAPHQDSRPSDEAQAQRHTNYRTFGVLQCPDTWVATALRPVSGSSKAVAQSLLRHPPTKTRPPGEICIAAVLLTVGGSVCSRPRG